MDLHLFDSPADFFFRSHPSVKVSVVLNRGVLLFFKDLLDSQEGHLNEKFFVDGHPLANLGQVLLLIGKNEQCI